MCVYKHLNYKNEKYTTANVCTYVIIRNGIML